MITIIDYKAGNLTSVQLAFEYIGCKVKITDKAQEILQAEKIVFPGVGAAKAAMDNLKKLKIIDAIQKVITDGVPFLGICIGMQVLFESSEEDGGTGCLGILAGSVKKFKTSDKSAFGETSPRGEFCKIPQMGWNAVKITKPHPVFAGIEDQSEFYFVHSFYPSPAKKEIIIGQTEYANAVFASAAGKGNLAAVQFHPERSGRIGLKLLENFSNWGGKIATEK
jgi:glutamine amidotransferase